MSATYEETLALVNIALPVAPPWDRAYFPPAGKIEQDGNAYYGAAATSQKLADDLIYAVQSLGIPVDSLVGSPAYGQYQSARHAAFTGHFTVQDIMWIPGQPMPTAEEYYSRIFPVPTVPPSTSTTPTPDLEAQVADHEKRIAALEQK